jgi:hypothetical protein
MVLFQRPSNSVFEPRIVGRYNLVVPVLAFPFPSATRVFGNCTAWIADVAARVPKENYLATIPFINDPRNVQKVIRNSVNVTDVFNR